jgi:heavy metal sensor kinase
MRVLDLSGLDHRPGGAVGPWDTAAFTRSWRGEVVHTTVVTQGLELRVCSLPGVRDGRIEVVIQMVEPLAPTWRALDQLTQTLVILIPLALALAALGGAFLTGRALQPVREITEAADRIEAENLSQRLPFEGTDEFARLAAVLNGMLERLEAAFERQKRFTGDASHELRTPLATIKAASSLAREDAWGAEACQAAMASIEGAADRAGRIIEDLLLLARADSGRLIGSTRAVSIEQPLDQALRETAGAAGGAPDRAPVLIDLPDTPLLVRGEPQHLTRLFINLLENALRHTPATGEITVSTRADRQHVIVTVRDTGEGISLEHLPRLGERFYRADAARSRASGGAGLGLAICKSIVEAHQGSLEIDSVVGEGTVVTVTLPRDHAGE